MTVLDETTQPPYPGEFWGPTDRWSDPATLKIVPLLHPEDPETFLRRFSPEEVNSIVAAIRATGKIPRLMFFHRAFRGRLQHVNQKPPFWFIPFVAYGNSYGSVLVFEENGFFGTPESPDCLTGMTIEIVDRLEFNHGSDGEFHDYPTPDSPTCTTMRIYFTQEGTEQILDVVERHGEDSDFGRQLLIVEAIWEIWSGVVERSRDSSVWRYDAVADCAFFSSWEGLLDWAAEHG